MDPVDPVDPVDPDLDSDPDLDPDPEHCLKEPYVIVYKDNKI
jgi:hypothetical protein